MSDRIVRRFAKNRVELREDGGESKITGLAAVFYDGTPETEFKLWRGVYERIMPEAFDRALSEAHDVRGLFNHNADHVLGRTKAGTLKLSKEPAGLRYEIALGETQIASDVAGHVRRGDVSGSSFAFIVTGENWVDEGEREIRQITDVELFDVGPVTYPAYEATTADAKSGEADPELARESYDTWKRTGSEALARAKVKRQRGRRIAETLTLFAVAVLAGVAGATSGPFCYDPIPDPDFQAIRQDFTDRVALDFYSHVIGARTFIRKRLASDCQWPDGMPLCCVTPPDGVDVDFGEYAQELFAEILAKMEALNVACHESGEERPECRERLTRGVLAR